MAAYETDDEIIHLKCKEELKLILCEPGDKVSIQLIVGSAEIFGSDLQINKEYTFSYFSSVAVFTWLGCTIKLREQTSKNILYKIRKSTQIPRMKDLHNHIEEIRANADVNHTDIPITLVTGPTDAGKSTLCRFLLNYAAKYGRRPIFIDLDVGQNSLSIAGTFGVLPILEQSAVDRKFNEDALCVYYFGYKSPGHNMKLYKLLLQKVARALQNRIHQSQTKSSGVLIDTCGWVDGEGYKLITEIIEVFQINMVLVLSQHSLYSKLKHDVSEMTKIVFVDKFKDVFTRNRTVRGDNRNSSVYKYFYGSSGQLKPYTIKVEFKDLQIFKAVDSKNIRQTSNVVPVLIDPSILYQVFALSYAENIERVLLSSVYGFISIVELDMNSKIITILSPQPGPLPTNYLLMGDITLTQKKAPS